MRLIVIRRASRHGKGRRCRRSGVIPVPPAYCILLAGGLALATACGCRSTLDAREPTDDPGAESLTHYAAGIRARLHGDNHKAVEHFRAAVESNPAAGRPSLQLALTLQQAGKPDEAAAALERLCSLRPEDAQARMWLASIYHLNEQYNHAAAAALDATRLNPAAAEGYVQAAASLLAADKPDKAEDALRRGRKNAEEQPPLLFNLGKILLLRAEQSREPERQAALVEQALGKLEKLLDLAPDHVEAMVMLAGIHLQREEPGRATDFLDRAAAASPDDPQVLQQMATAYAAAGEIHKAIKILQEMMDLTDGTPRQHLLLGNIYRQLGRHTEAADHFRQALESPRPPAAAFMEAANLRLREEPNEAISLLQRGLTVHPDDPRLLHMLARVYLAEERFSQAVRVFEDTARILEEDEKEFPPMFDLRFGIAALQAGKEQQATECLKRVTGRNPELLGTLVQHLLESNDAELLDRGRRTLRALEIEAAAPALAQLEAAAALAADEEDAGSSLLRAVREQPGTLHLLASWIFQHPDREDLGAAFRRALHEKRGEFRDQRTVLFFLGHIAGMLSEYRSAAEYFAELEPLLGEPGEDPLADADFYFFFGTVQERLERYEEAERLLEKCLALEPQHHKALNYQAYTWAERNVKLEKAETYSRRSLELDPDNGAYLDTLAWILYRRGRHEEALKYIREALEQLPRDPVILDHAGDILDALGRHSEAVEAWEKSFRMEEKESTADKLKDAGHPPKPQ